LTSDKHAGRVKNSRKRGKKAAAAGGNRVKTVGKGVKKG